MKQGTNNSSHWDEVYRRRGPTGVSWFTPRLAKSLEFLQRFGLESRSRVLDVGGGASTLIDDLLAYGVEHPTVVDLSAQAIQLSRDRLDSAASRVDWRVGDVTRDELPGDLDFWHDRAVLHFLWDEKDVKAYARQAADHVRPGGCAIIAGFAPDGPLRCSGLPVVRRSAAEIERCLAPAFRLVAQETEFHRTPSGAEQSFVYAVLVR